LEQRQIVIAGLVDGRTYDEIRADLAAAGVAAAGLPHNSSFIAYRRSEEYQRQEQDLRNWQRRAEEKRQFWSAVLAGGGADGLANIATFEAIEELRAALGSAESAGEKARVAAVIGNLTRTVQAEADARAKRELATRAAKVETAAVDPKLTPEERIAAIRATLGVA